MYTHKCYILRSAHRVTFVSAIYNYYKRGEHLQQRKYRNHQYNDFFCSVKLKYTITKTLIIIIVKILILFVNNSPRRNMIV